MDNRLRDRRAIQHELSSAIARNELRLHYQPLAKIDGEVIGFEALVRWHNPQRGMVSAATLFPVGVVWPVEDFARGVSILRRLKTLGVHIAMDDFGTGYSSLSYLQAFPFDKIKIDQTFIAKIGTNNQATAIIHAIVGLGRALALPVIAEGVETEEQLAFLVTEGCNEVQGYFIGRPQPIAHYRSLLTGLAGGSDNAALAS